MFHMMIYMYKKAESYDKARQLFAMMPERGVQQTTVTYNSLMSFETNYKKVANMFDQVGSKVSAFSFSLLFFSYDLTEIVLLCFSLRVTIGVWQSKALKRYSDTYMV